MGIKLTCALHGHCQDEIRHPCGGLSTVCACSVASVVSDSASQWNCSPPGGSVHGILQARILEWVAMSSPRRSSWPRNWTHVSYISCAGRLNSPSLGTATITVLHVDVGPGWGRGGVPKVRQWDGSSRRCLFWLPPSPWQSSSKVRHEFPPQQGTPETTELLQWGLGPSVVSWYVPWCARACAVFKITAPRVGGWVGRIPSTHPSPCILCLVSWAAWDFSVLSSLSPLLAHDVPLERLRQSSKRTESRAGSRNHYILHDSGKKPFLLRTRSVTLLKPMHLLFYSILPVTQGVKNYLRSPFYTYRNWGSEKIKNSPRNT